MERSPDAIVVGSGIIGTATALELARQGRRVVVLDKGDAVGGGSTSASSSIHSWPIMVESMSARKSFLARPASGWIMTSTGPAAIAADAEPVAVTPLLLARRLRRMNLPGTLRVVE